MPISHNNRFIFIHIPKTGGTSIENYLNIRRLTKNLLRHSAFVKFQYNGTWYPLHHLPATIVKKIHPNYFKKYYKFSFVRNPYQRMLSLYVWLNEEKLQNLRNDSSDSDIILATEQFEKWIDYFFKKNDYRNLSQTEYLYSGKKLIVDEVYKFEDMHIELDRLKKRLNINFDASQIHNASAKTFDRNKLLTDSIKEKIYNFYKEDFDNFGYEK